MKIIKTRNIQEQTSASFWLTKTPLERLEALEMKRTKSCLRTNLKATL